MYPGAPNAWEETISLNLYASLIFLAAQGLFLLIWRSLLWVYRNRKTPIFVRTLEWVALTMVPFFLFIIGLRLESISRSYFLTFAISLLPLLWVVRTRYMEFGSLSMQNYAKTERLRQMGFHDAVVQPHVDDYKHFLNHAVSDFALLGIGAEKLTRNFENFRSMVNRCGTTAKPVRLLLVSPKAEWLGDGARRRGLGKSNFKEIQIASLKRIARVHDEFGGRVQVRFYDWRPVFRLLFSNHNECWFGHYSESVSAPGTNEYIDKSNSNVVVMAPKGKALDLEFFGALQHHFDELWEQSREKTWDFKTYIK